MESEETPSHPWIYELSRTKMTTDQENNYGTETCAFRRDFDTSLSNIPIKAGVVLKVMAGYKMYQDKL